VLSILSLPTIGEMNLFRKSQTFGRLEEELILKHDVTELRFSFQKFQEFVEGDRGVTMQVQFLNDMIPTFFALHNTLSQLSE